MNTQSSFRTPLTGNRGGDDSTNATSVNNVNRFTTQAPQPVVGTNFTQLARGMQNLSTASQANNSGSGVQFGPSGASFNDDLSTAGASALSQQSKLGSGIPSTIHGRLSEASSSDTKKKRLFKTPSSLEKLETLCCGKIGTTARTFCILEKADCGKTHQGGLMDIKRNQLYIKTNNNGNVAYCEPCCSVRDIHDDLIDDWCTEARTTDDWIDIFNRVSRCRPHISPGTLISSAELEQITRDEAEIKQEQYTPYPKKRRKESERPNPVHAPIFGTCDFEIGDSKDTSEFVSKYGNETILATLVELESRTKLLHSAMSNLIRQVDFNAASITDLAALAKIEVDKLYSLIGEKTDLPDEMDAPTIWTSIARICEQESPHFTKLQTRLNQIQIDMAKYANIDSTIDQALKPFTDELRSLRQDLNSVSSSSALVQKISQDIQGMELFATQVLSTMTEHANTIGHLQTQIDKIRIVGMNAQSGPPMSTFHQAAQQMGNFGTSASMPMSASVSAPPPPPPHMPPGWESRIEDLENKFEAYMKMQETETIKFFNLGFKDFNDAVAWLHTNHALDDFGLLVDPHMVMEHIYQQLAEEDILKSLQTFYKLKIEDINQGIAITSFQNKIWRFLDPSSMQTVPKDKSYFANIPDFKVWSRTIDGKKKIFKQQLTEFVKNHKQHLENKLSVNDPMYQLALHSLLETKTFVLGLFEFMERLYQEYVETGFGEARAWYITTRLIRKLIEMLAAPRNGVKTTFQPGNLKQIKEQMFYASLRSLDVMVYIFDLDFEDVPAMGTELIKYLVTNSQGEAVKELVLVTKSLRKDQDANQKSLQNIIATNSTNANKFDNQQREIASMKQTIEKMSKRLQQLEQRKHKD